MSKKVNIFVDGMTCQACSMKVEKGLSKLKIVEDVSVNLMSKTVTVSVEDGAKVEGLIGVIKRLGYKPKKDELKIEKSSIKAEDIEKIISELKEKDTVLVKDEDDILKVKYLKDVVSLDEINSILEKYKISVKKEKKERLHDQRLNAVTEKLKMSGAKSVIDLGCGDGKLIRLLLKEKQFEKIAGMDVSYSELTKCKERLHWEDMPPKQKEKLSLFQSSLMYRDKRFSGFEAAAVVEVIEHMD